MKVGDLVKILKYGSRNTPDGSLGIVTELRGPVGPGKSLIVWFKCLNGYIHGLPEQYVEVVSEGR